MAEKFWANSALEPKRKHRWLLYLGGTDIPAYVIKTAGKPAFSVNAAEHMFFGHKFYYPGVVTWEPIDITLVDPVDPFVGKELYRTLTRGGYREPSVTEDGAPFTMSKRDSVGALNGQLRIQQLGANNSEIETFKLWNPWIQAIKFGDLDYTSDDMVEITITVQYDYATIH